MACHTRPAEPHEPDEAPAAQSQTLLGDELQHLHGQTSSAPSKESRPPQPTGSSTPPPLQIIQETVSQDTGEPPTVLPRAPSPEPLRSSSGHVDQADNTPTVTLHRSGYILLVVSIYASLALTAWLLICILASRPLTTKRYGYDFYGSSSDNGRAKYLKNKEIYRAARTVQAVVTVLTIPLTSAVCSAAAVVFVQSKIKKRHLTMRQMMALADKGWTDPSTIARLMVGRGRRLSSSFFIFALLLNLFGASITILQAAFLSQRTIKVPARYSERRSISRVFDIPNFFEQDANHYQPRSVTNLTRNALKSTFNTTPQPRLWQEGIGCALAGGRTEQCILEVPTFEDFEDLSNPYLAPLPVGYHTGVIKQFIPRINSTVKWDIVSPDDVSFECAERPDSFHALYASAWPPETDQHLPRSWSIEVCMPAYQSVSPWKNTTTRQDFTEELFLNISVIGYELDEEVHRLRKREDLVTGGTFRVTSATTAGYFELPNYMNGGQSGPITDGDPDDSEHCGIDCARQTYESRTPLLTVAIALFGPDSFISAQLRHLETLVKDDDDQPEAGSGSGGCVDQMPLFPLLHDPYMSEANSIGCIKDYARSFEMMDSELVAYVGSFFPSGLSAVPVSSFVDRPGLLSNAFESAVFLANEAWLVLSRDFDYGTRNVYSDPGFAMVIPEISSAGIVVISSLWAIYLACLLSLAVYSVRTPRWTNQLDAFAMIRVGAATTDERICWKVGFETQTIDALDDLPGFIGDATEGEGDVGRLGMGSLTPLNGTRAYRCYRGDEMDAELHAELRDVRKARSELAGRGTLPTHFERDGQIYMNRGVKESRPGDGRVSFQDFKVNTSGK